MISKHFRFGRARRSGALPGATQPTFHGLDRLDEEIRKHVTAANGTFVELGAYDGIQQSNTLHFENAGWRGLLIEPIPEMYRRCGANRPLAKVVNCACVAPEFPETEIEMIFAGLMSVTKGAFDDVGEQETWIERGERLQDLTRYTVSVPARTLSAVIDDAGLVRIDLLCLDVEGYELNVLKGLDLTRHRPKFIVCEDAYTDDVTDFLRYAGYELNTVLAEHQHVRDLLLLDTAAALA